MDCQHNLEESSGERIDATSVLPLCKTHGFGRERFIHKQKTTSTNDDARLFAAKGAASGTVIVAEQQTAGRGRQGRQWISPANAGIYVSILLTSIPELAKAPLLGIMAATAVAKAIHRVTGAKAEIKWPNDIILHDKKIAGILTESETKERGNYQIIIGVGINVNTPLSELPLRTRFPASSLRVELKNKVNRPLLLAAFLDNMYDNYKDWQNGKTDRALQMWSDAAYHKGKIIHIRQHQSITNGTMLGIDPSGALLLQDADGNIQRFVSGEILADV